MYFLQNVMGIMQETYPETTDSCWSFMASVFSFNMKSKLALLCFVFFLSSMATFQYFKVNSFLVVSPAMYWVHLLEDKQERVKGNNCYSKRHFPSSFVSYTWMLFSQLKLLIYFIQSFARSTIFLIVMKKESAEPKKKNKSYQKVGISLADLSASWMLVLWCIHIESNFSLHLVFFPTKYIS